MLRQLRSFLIIALIATLASGCSKQPGHVRYIPKDAVAVAGINLKSLGKKIAWNMITGSKLFKEMQTRIPEKSAKDAVNGIEKAGIDAMNTFYVYVKPDTRFKGGNRITGLVPLSDAAAWETYVKQVFPGAVITQHGDRKETTLGTDMYVGWNSSLMIIINVLDADDEQSTPQTMAATLTSEMESAFALPSDNSITTLPNFTKLQDESHDISFWLNYSLLMNQYSGDMADKMGGLSLSTALWKDAAFAAGFDFKKGKITGDMLYYLSPELKDVGKELGATNADKEMLDRLPNRNLDMLMAMHISPTGLKAMLEKTGILGLANAGLSTQGMNADFVLDAFTGDMAIVMNEFSLHAEEETDMFMGKPVVHTTQKPGLSMSYVLKINKKENFAKLTAMAAENGLLPIPNGYVMPISLKDSVYILMNDKYAVASNKYANAEGILAGTYKATKMPEAASAYLYGHPAAVYLDIQEMFRNIDPAIAGNSQDSAMMSESRKLLSSIAVNGGAFKNNAFEYHLELNFMNKDENTIIELMDYGMKMSDAGKIKE